jgi:hypothetical protein
MLFAIGVARLCIDPIVVIPMEGRLIPENKLLAHRNK